MKRTKPGSLPTRIMPRRGKTRQNTASDVAAGEDSQEDVPVDGDRPRNTNTRTEQSESLLETASTSAQGSGSSHRKRKRQHKVNVASAETLLPSEASTSTGTRNSRESPEQACSICLGAVENRAFTDACYHTFCFECLVEWSKVRAVCPLCKKSFHSIIHSFRSYDDYKLYQVPKNYVPNAVNVNNPSVNVNNEPLPPSSTFSARAGRFFNDSSYAPVLGSINDDHQLEVRRRVYANSDEMQLVGLWSSDGIVMPPANQVSPAMFDCYPVMLQRVRPWVFRDIVAIAGSGHIQTIADIVLGLLRQFPVTSDDFYERLFPYLGLHTRRFLLELDAFTRSPFDMAMFDARVVYGAGVNVEPAAAPQLSTEHVEDISSSDDSDIELLSPAVASASESSHSSYVSMLTDHVVPDLLNSLRTIQQSLFMSLSDMSRRSLNSRLESPVPGPSGLGQQVAVASDENDSVVSHASMLAHDGEDRSDSPMILSDADSDIVVVDVSRSVQSPIHISSGEDDAVAQQIKALQRIKRRRRHSRPAEKHGHKSEPNSVLAVDTEHAEDSQSESHADKPSSYSVESNAEDLMPAAEQNVSSSHTQDQSSSHCNSVQLNNHSSACSQPSPSKPCETAKSTDTAVHSYHHSHLKRSLSTSSMSTVPAVSESSSGDVKPLPCKKHVSGHKSSKSKQRVRELLAEKRSPEGISSSAEKVFSGSRDQKDVGSSENDEQIAAAEASSEVTASHVGESSAASQDFSNNPPPVCYVPERPTAEQLITGNQLDDRMEAPCIREVQSLPFDSILSPAVEDNQCSSFSTAEVTYDTADQRSSVAVENSDPVSENVGLSSCDVIQLCAVDADEPQGNAADVAIEDSNADDGDAEAHAASVHSSDLVLSGNVDADGSVVEIGAHDESVTECLPLPANLPPLPGPIVTSECSESSCNSVTLTASSTSCNGEIHRHSVESRISDNNVVDGGVDKPFESGSVASFLVVPRENKTETSTNSRSPPELYRFFDDDNNYLRTDAASSENLVSESSLPSCSISNSVSQVSSDYGETDRRQSVGSVSHCEFVIEENDIEQTSYGLVIGSPVGVDDSSDSDSEVEWLGNGVSGRQRCISVSSSDSSIHSLSDSDVELVFSDSDCMEIFESEPQPSQSDAQSTELISPTTSQPLSALSTASLPLAPDVPSEQVHFKKEESVTHDAGEPSTSTEQFTSYVAVQSYPGVDGCSSSSGIDSNVTPTEELAVQQ